MNAQPARRILLESHAPDGVMRILSDTITLGDGQKESWETITRVIQFEDAYYGEVKITREMLATMVKNFNDDVYGQEIVVDVSHNFSNGGAGFIRELQLQNGKLRGRIEWTPMGIEAVKEKGFRYFSADYHENHKDQETGKKYGPTLYGAALTTRPRVKRLDPINPDRLQLSLDGDDQAVATVISPFLVKKLSTEIADVKDKFKKLYQKALSEMKSLSEEAKGLFLSQFEAALDGVTEEAQASILLSSFTAVADSTGKQLAEAGTAGAVKLDFSGLAESMRGIGAGSGNGLSVDEVKKLLAEDRQAAADAEATAKASHDKLVKTFTDKIMARDGFSDELKKQLTEGAVDLVAPSMSEDQVLRLADNQLRLGDQIVAQQKLAAMGYTSGATGSVRLSIDDSGTAKTLQDQINDGLRKTSSAANGRLVLANETSPFLDEVLTAFDALHAHKLHAEQRQMASGEVGTVDTNLPVGFQRTVIREALSDLRILEIVQTLTDASATATTQIPYELRDISQVHNNGVVYEGQPIHRAGISQEMDLAYINPMKLAMLISNEVVHFTRASAINWDAYARNVESNARLIRELIARRISNELQRSADAYLAADVSNEDLDSQLTGSANTVKTTNFPIVRPHQQRDLKGTAVGSVENAITVRLNGTAIDEYDGTGDQSAGTYYRITNYNLGYVQFVNEAGVPQTPSATASADDISYSYATNVVKWDVDLPASTTKAQHWNAFLQKIGERTAVLNQDRFVMPDFMLASYTLHNDATDAENFTSAARRDDAGTNGQGQLAAIKGLPAWATNGVSDLGEERAIIGQRGALTYTVAKPFMTGQPFEAVDSNGKPIGKLQAYGEEYSAIKVPSPIRNRLTSVIAYSATGR